MVSLSVIQKDFDSTSSLSTESGGLFRLRYVFSLPEFIQVWWKSFRPEGELYLGVVKEEDQLIGVAPLIIEDQKCSFIGNPSVCDYLDFSIVSGKEYLFYHSLLDDLDKIGLNILDLLRLRPESQYCLFVKRSLKSEVDSFIRKRTGFQWKWISRKTGTEHLRSTIS